MTRTHRLAIVALVLWTALDLGLAVYLMRHRAATEAAGHGHAASGAESRHAIILPPGARDAVLGEMRVMLGAVEGALAAASRGDTAALRRATQPAGMAMAADPELEKLFPADWMRLALATHRAFDSLPAVGPDPAALSARLSGIVHGCNGCHATYRLEAAPR